MLQLLADVVAARTTALIATNRFRRAAFFQTKKYDKLQLVENKSNKKPYPVIVSQGISD
jgi:hypothetical protein